jgi:hypothetical protein
MVEILLNPLVRIICEKYYVHYANPPMPQHPMQAERRADHQAAREGREGSPSNMQMGLTPEGRLPQTTLYGRCRVVGL